MQAAGQTAANGVSEPTTTATTATTATAKEHNFYSLVLFIGLAAVYATFFSNGDPVTKCCISVYSNLISLT